MEGRKFLRFMSLLLAVFLLFVCTVYWSSTILPYNTLHPVNKVAEVTLRPPGHKPDLEPVQTHDHASDVPRHPLDPLTVKELNRVRSILSSHTIFRKAKAYTLHNVVVEEPPKTLVLKWKEGDPLPPRKASVVARVDGVKHVLSVDLISDQVVRVDMGGVSGYPTLTIEDMRKATFAPFSSAEFNKTILDRGVDLVDLACLPISSGWFGKKEEEKRRLIKVQCYTMKDTANFYMRPIEGLTVLVDLDTNEVLEITDHGKDIPIPKAANTDYRLSAQTNTHNKIKAINPISIEQSKGPSFTIENGHMVKWANWEFHLKPDPRAGLIISRAMVRDPDSGELRSVMYKGMSSELFVPYMDPTDAWYFKTYMDAGEYGFGLQAMPLVPLNDCPRNAYYMDGVFATGDGTPYVRSNMVCVFESYAGDIGWRHSESPITGLEVKNCLSHCHGKIFTTFYIYLFICSIAHTKALHSWEFRIEL